MRYELLLTPKQWARLQRKCSPGYTCRTDGTEYGARIPITKRVDAEIRVNRVCGYPCHIETRISGPDGSIWDTRFTRTLDQLIRLSTYDIALVPSGPPGRRTRYDVRK